MNLSSELQEAIYYLTKANQPVDIYSSWKLGIESQDLKAIIALENYNKNIYPGKLRSLINSKDNDFVSYFKSEKLYFVDDELIKEMLLANKVDFPIDYSIMFDTNYASFIKRFIHSDTVDFNNNIFRTIHILIKEDFQYDYWFYITENCSKIESIDTKLLKDNNKDLYENLLSLELFKTIDKEKFRRNGEIIYRITKYEASDKVDKLLDDLSSKEGKAFLEKFIFFHKQMVLFLIGVFKIQFKSNAYPKKKISELFDYTNEVVGAYLEREMIIAYKYFKDRNQVLSLYKVNKGGNQSKLLKKIENIAWDFTLPRIMEFLIANNEEGRFFLPFGLSNDRGLRQLFELYNTKGIIFKKHGFRHPFIELSGEEFFKKEQCDIDFEDYFSEELKNKRRSKSDFNRKYINNVIEEEYTKLVELML